MKHPHFIILKIPLEKKREAMNDNQETERAFRFASNNRPIAEEEPAAIGSSTATGRAEAVDVAGTPAAFFFLNRVNVSGTCSSAGPRDRAHNSAK